MRFSKETADTIQKSLHSVEEVTTGSTPIVAGSDDITIITSGGSAGVEIIKLIDLEDTSTSGPFDPKLNGRRHMFILQNQTDPADEVHILTYQSNGTSTYSPALYGWDADPLVTFSAGVKLNSPALNIVYEWITDDGWVLTGSPALNAFPVTAFAGARGYVPLLAQGTPLTSKLFVTVEPGQNPALLPLSGLGGGTVGDGVDITPATDAPNEFFIFDVNGTPGGSATLVLNSPVFIDPNRSGGIPAIYPIGKKLTVMVNSLDTLISVLLDPTHIQQYLPNQTLATPSSITFDTPQQFITLEVQDNTGNWIIVRSTATVAM